MLRHSARVGRLQQIAQQEEHVHYQHMSFLKQIRNMTTFNLKMGGVSQSPFQTINESTWSADQPLPYFANSPGGFRIQLSMTRSESLVRGMSISDLWKVVSSACQMIRQFSTQPCVSERLQLDLSPIQAFKAVTKVASSVIQKGKHKSLKTRALKNPDFLAWQHEKWPLTLRVQISEVGHQLHAVSRTSDHNTGVSWCSHFKCSMDQDYKVLQLTVPNRSNLSYSNPQSSIVPMEKENTVRATTSS